MATTLEIACAGCGALYRILGKKADVSVVFQCVHCHEHNLFHLARSLLLNPQIMCDGAHTERRAHVRRRLEDAALQALADVGGRLDTLVNINVDLDFAPRLDPPGLENPPGAKPSPRPADAPPMDEDAEDEDGDMFEDFTDTTERRPITDADVETFRKSLEAPDFWNRLNQQQ